MTSYLLDTHSFLWSILEPEKLGQQAIEVLENYDNAIIVSSITFWEISLKYSLGKFTLGCKPDDLIKIAEDMGFAKVSLTPEEAALFYQLPRLVHKDPFDRMLIWQAIANNLTLISVYSHFENYGQFGLKVIW